jgi:PAT family beta-lactamase induction signal transducer AmpG
VSLYLSEKRWLRFVALCVFYVSQGLPDGFVRTGIKTYLIREGASTAAVGGLIALISWPWAVKWIWGPVIDRFGNSSLGRRRPWIIAAQFMMIATMSAILLTPSIAVNLTLLGAAILLINAFSSMQDVAIDALAIDILPENERGLANGFMFGSADIGRFLGSAVVGGVLLAWGVRPAICLEVALLALIALFALAVRERRGDALLPARGSRRPTGAEGTPPASLWSLLDALRRAFGRRAALLAALLAVLSLSGTSAFLVFWPVYLQRQAGWSSGEYLRLEGAYGMICGMLGSLCGGVTASWLGAKRSTLASLAAIALLWLAYAATPAMWSSDAVITILFCLGAWLFNVFQVSMFALFMGVCRSTVAATQFSAYMALLNVSSSLGSVGAGMVAADSHLPSVFLALAGLYAAQFALVSLIRIADGADDANAAAPAIVGFDAAHGA